MTSLSATSRPAFFYALVLALAMTAVVGTALAFQYLGGYIPCALCLLQRQPYYYAIPIALLAAVVSLTRTPSWIARALILAVGLLMLVNAGIAVYHAGVEWHFWPGPTTCSTTASGVTQDAGNLLNDLNAVKGPSCTDAALRVFGLSFAGWNVLASLALALLAGVGVRKSA